LELPNSGGKKTIKCSKCGAIIKPGIKFCPDCGDPYSPCPKCGTDLPEGSAQCPDCGFVLPKPCPYCGKLLEKSDAKFCPDCGGALVKKCPSCQFEVPEKTKFCPECGTKIQESAD
jgi:RNA polymerase subunit RPABC4/transcription elongation factor Spt4